MKNNNGGFTLVEVMVAVAVLAIALPTLLLVMMQEVDGTGYLRDKLQAQWVAENQLVQIRLNNRSTGEVPAEKTEGKEELAGRTWQWQSEVKAFEQMAFSDMYGIKVSVWYGNSNIKKDSPLVSLVGILHRSNGQPIKRPAPETLADQKSDNAAGENP